MTSQWSTKYQKRLFWIEKTGTSLKFIGEEADMLQLADAIAEEVNGHGSLGAESGLARGVR